MIGARTSQKINQNPPIQGKRYTREVLKQPRERRPLGARRQASHMEVDTAPMESPAAAATAATATGAASSSGLPPPPKTTAKLIADALTTEPQTSEEVYANMVMLCSGSYALPSLNTVQSALSTRGDNFATKVLPTRGGDKRTRWVIKEKEVEVEKKKASSSKAHGKKGAGSKAGGAKGGVQKTSAKSGRALKPSQKKKAEEAAARKAALEHQAQLRRVDDVVARPMSAFVLFGFSQRGVLKKQKSAADFREVVKAIGERWALLSDDDRAKYEKMAGEDQKRSDSQAVARAAAAKASAAAAAAAEQAAAAEAEAAAQAVQERGGDGDDGAEDIDEEGANDGGEDVGDDEAEDEGRMNEEGDEADGGADGEPTGGAQ